MKYVCTGMHFAAKFIGWFVCDNLFQKFAYNAGEANGSVVTGRVALAFPEYLPFSKHRVARLYLVTSETDVLVNLH